ncbi:hypothetical protein EDM56_13755 [Brevibacillus fluminis]|uniref:DUF1700 domain-containing protein n=1 Tax=Brevibacillus fluminis TaxID=511487 RepID=A0A3M8DJ63_9BACL|nr:permease prefix domain 1-containing protein [Brevibacillus fluminis]RNB87639.1 hypothetical protein EDM56_13755 [Brevibacillus fluminis]
MYIDVFYDEAYLYTVMQLLPNGVNKKQVLQELRSHIAESVRELQAKGFTERDAMLETFRQLGSPREITNQFARIKHVIRFQLAMRLLAINIVLFFLGTAVVIFYLPKTLFFLFLYFLPHKCCFVFMKIELPSIPPHITMS